MFSSKILRRLREPVFYDLYSKLSKTSGNHSLQLIFELRVQRKGAQVNTHGYHKIIFNFIAHPVEKSPFDEIGTGRWFKKIFGSPFERICELYDVIPYE